MIPSEYKIHFLSPAGDLRAVVVDYQSFHLVREINKLGELVITLRGDHPALASLEHKSLVEVWRRDKDHALTWTCEARYIYLYYSHSTKEIGQVVIRCVDPLWWLTTRIIAYDVNVSDRTIFNHSPGIIINLLVKYNATTFATVVNGRFREGNIPQVLLYDSVPASTAIIWECPYENLLSNIQKLGLIGPCYFNMVYQGAGVWKFYCFYDQLSTDCSASIIFSVELDNMTDPVYVLDRRAEKTVALVGGKVVRGDRNIGVYYGPDYSSSNDAETWVAAPNIMDFGATNSASRVVLERLRKKDDLSFSLIQTPALFYGKDYFFGDKVTTVYQGVSRVQMLNKVTIDAAPTGEISLVVRSM